MKKILLNILFVLIFNTAFCQDSLKIKLMVQLASEWGFLTYYTPQKGKEIKWFNELREGLRGIDQNPSLTEYKRISSRINEIAQKRYRRNKWKRSKLKDRNNLTALDSTLFCWIDEPIYDSKQKEWFEAVKLIPVATKSDFVPSAIRIGEKQLITDISKLEINDKYDLMATMIMYWNAVRYYSAYPIGEKARWADVLYSHLLDTYKRCDSGNGLQARQTIDYLEGELKDAHITGKNVRSTHEELKYNWDTHAVVDDSTLYVNFRENVHDSTLFRILGDNWDKKHVILDCRNYPINIYHFDKYNLLLSSMDPFCYRRIPSLNYPGLFIYDSLVMERDPTKAKEYCKDKQFYFLINERVCSTAEYKMLGMMASLKGTIIGRPTAGVPSIVNYIWLPEEQIYIFSAWQVYDYKHRLVSGCGIEPDIFVDTTEIMTDKILEAALLHIRGSLQTP